MASPSLLYNQSYDTLMGKMGVIQPIAITAPMALIASLLIVFTIWRTKELHNNSHYVMASLATADAMFSVQVIIYAVRVTIRIRDATPLIVPSWMCILNSQLLYVPAQASNMLCVGLGVDRFLCVAAPVFYHKLRAKYYIMIMNVVAYTWCFMLAIISMIGTDVTAMWNCEASIQQYNILGEVLQPSYANPGIKAFLMGILYISAASVLLYRYKRAALNGSSSQQRSEWRRRWEIQTFLTTCGVGFVAVAIQIPRVLPLFFEKTDYRLATVVSFLSVVLEIEAIMNFVVCLAIDTTFRKGFQKAFAIKKFGQSSVSPMWP